MRWPAMRRVVAMLGVAAGAGACGGDTIIEPRDVGVTLADVRIDQLSPEDFTAPAPLPVADPSIPLPDVQVDSTQGPRFNFPVTVRFAARCETILILPEGATRYVGVVMPPAANVWSVVLRRVAGATPRAARMQIALGCTGKVSRPVTVPVPFF
jgi:hypothetical protein